MAAQVVGGLTHEAPYFPAVAHVVDSSRLWSEYETVEKRSVALYFQLSLLNCYEVSPHCY